jgi:hypothetical protein
MYTRIYRHTVVVAALAIVFAVVYVDDAYAAATANVAAFACVVVGAATSSVIVNLPQLNDRTMISLGTMVTVMLTRQYNQ